MTKENCSMEEIMSKLQAPFSSKDIEWRVSRSGVSNGKSWAMVLAYVTNRAIQNRLDEVFGPAGWKNDYRDFMQGILCTITCYVDGEWVSKSDGAEQTQFESLKGGLSSAMKRAAVQWGIGRYLYNLDEVFVEVTNNKGNGAIFINDEKKKVKGYWLPPKLPNWALPEGEKTQRNSSNHSQSSRAQEPNKQQQKNEQNSGQQQKNQRNQKSGEFNRDGALKAIGEYLKVTGLTEKKGLIMPLFKKVNPKTKLTTINEVYDKATEEELKVFYKVLRPVFDLINIVNFRKVAMEDALQYVQILCPEVRIESLFSCFINLTSEKVKEVNELIIDDLKNGVIQKIA